VAERDSARQPLPSSGDMAVVPASELGSLRPPPDVPAPTEQVAAARAGKGSEAIHPSGAVAAASPPAPSPSGTLRGMQAIGQGGERVAAAQATTTAGARTATAASPATNGVLDRSATAENESLSVGMNAEPGAQSPDRASKASAAQAPARKPDALPSEPLNVVVRGMAVAEPRISIKGGSASQAEQVAIRPRPRSAGSALDYDDRAHGVPRARGPAMILVATIALALSAILALAGFRQLRARQQRDAEERAAHEAAAATTGESSVELTPFAHPERTAPSAAAPVPSAQEAAANPRAAESATSAPATAPAARPPSIAPAAAPPQPPPPPRHVRAEPPPSRAPKGEAPLEVAAPSAGGSLIALANHDLANGAIAHAVQVARQATAENPADANAWLTLGAAYAASGNAAAAHEAYRNCAANARGPNVSECRTLAAQR